MLPDDSSSLLLPIIELIMSFIFEAVVRNGDVTIIRQRIDGKRRPLMSSILFVVSTMSTCNFDQSSEDNIELS